MPFGVNVNLKSLIADRRVSNKDLRYNRGTHFGTNPLLVEIATYKPVNIRKDFWDCNRGMERITGASSITIPEVLVKINSSQFPSV